MRTYATEEMEWSDRQEAGEFDDLHWYLGADGEYHSRCGAPETQEEADREEYELDRREAEAQ